MRVNPSDPTPGYVQIAADLRRAISRDELPNGAKLPSVRQLMGAYGVSDGTIAKAIDQLRNEGLVITRQGQGAFVRRPRRYLRNATRRHLRSARPDGTAPMEAEAGTQGFVRDQELVDVATGPCPADVAGRLQVETGSPVVVRRHLMTLDGEPAQTADSYFPLALVEGSRIPQFEKIPGGVHSELARATGRTFGPAWEEMLARMPTPEESQLLRLPPGTPVVELWRTIRDSAGAPMEVSRFLFDGARHSFGAEVPMD